LEYPLPDKKKCAGAPTKANRGLEVRLTLAETNQSPPIVARCNQRKAKKKYDHEVRKNSERYWHEREVQRCGGRVGKKCRGSGVRYCLPPQEKQRRSERMSAYNEARCYFNELLGINPTHNLPGAPSQDENFINFRKGSDKLAYDFTYSQLMPTVELEYTELSPNRYSEVACTFDSRICFWERDFDISFKALPMQLAVKGEGYWKILVSRSLGVDETNPHSPPQLRNKRSTKWSLGTQSNSAESAQ
jgi:hypothetical protein